MVPDSTVPTNVECVNDIYDQSYKRNVPSSVLPDGVPFGDKYHRSLYVSRDFYFHFLHPFHPSSPFLLPLLFFLPSSSSPLLPPHILSVPFSCLSPSLSLPFSLSPFYLLCSLLLPSHSSVPPSPSPPHLSSLSSLSVLCLRYLRMASCHLVNHLSVGILYH